MSPLKKPLPLPVSLGTGVFLLASAWAASAAPVDDIKTRLEQGLHREAYDIGKAAPDALGTPLFDFYFGIAALNAGAPGEGVLALERYVLQFPDNRSALFQLARGYFILGDDARAREEFTGLMAGASGPERAHIEQFLDAIRTRESRYKPSASAFVELGAGHDSNVNSGIASGQVTGLPLGVIVLPGQSSERQSGGFGTVAAGGQGVVPVAPGVALYAGAQLSGRVHRQAQNDLFDTSLLGLQAGVSVVQGRHLARVGVDLTQVALARQPYLNLNTLVGEWQYQHDQFNRYGASLQWSDQRYQDIDTYLDLDKTVKVVSSAEGRDSRLTHVSTFWTRTLSHAWHPEFTLGLNAGSDQNRQHRPDLSRALWGARASAALHPAPHWTLAGGVSYQNSRYDADYSEGVAARQDDFYALDLSVSYAIDRHWSVRGEYQGVHQQSNIGFFNYRRDQLAVKLRYDFK